MTRYLLMALMLGFGVSPAYAFTPEFLGAVAGGGGVTSTPFLTDTFTEASDTILTSHTSDSGGTWAKLNMVAAQTFTVNGASDYVSNSGTDGDIAYNSATPPSADYSVTATINNTTSTTVDRLAGPCVRVQADGSGYCATLGGSGIFSIREYAPGGTNIYGAVLSTATYSVAVSTEYTITLSITGSDLSATVDGLGTITATDASVTNAGKAGITIRRNNTRVTSVAAQ